MEKCTLDNSVYVSFNVLLHDNERSMLKFQNVGHCRSDTSTLPCDPGTQLSFYVTSVSLPYLVSKGMQCTNNYLFSLAVGLLSQYGCDGLHTGME